MDYAYWLVHFPLVDYEGLYSQDLESQHGPSPKGGRVTRPELPGLESANDPSIQASPTVHTMGPERTHPPSQVVKEGFFWVQSTIKDTL